MTKAEKARLDKAEANLRIATALRWSGFKEPATLPIPNGITEYVNGWSINAHAEGSVRKAWTESMSHGDGHRSDNGRWGDVRISASQNCARLYATKRDALIALRIAKERQFAEALSKIDENIEAADADEAQR